MVHINRNWLLSLAFLLSMAASAFGQTDWDAVLDRYESISRQCLELREKVLSGEAVADRSITNLLQELVQLKNTLQDASGSMTPSQRKRFARIRDDYARASGNNSANPAINDQPETSKPKPATRTNKQHAPDTTAKTKPATQPRPVLPQLSSLTTPAVVLKPPATSLSQRENIQPPYLRTENMEMPGDPPVKNLYGYMLASVSIPEPHTFGGMASITGRRLGGYISGRSNFHAVRADYSCTADGVITGGGRFWGDGTKDHKAWTVCAGPVVRLGYHLSVYAGGGLGARTLYWHDVGGQWAEVTDQSFKGLDMEAGAIASWRHLALSAGINWLVPARQATVSLGLGLAF